MSSDIQEGLRCPLCLDLARDAVETSCCQYIYCEQCLDQHKDASCPTCRTDQFKYTPSSLSRRLLANIQEPCPNECGEKPARSDVIKHLQICTKRQYTCPMKECNVQGIANEFMKHLCLKHKQITLQMAEKWLPTETDQSKKECKVCPVKKCQQKIPKDEFGNHLQYTHANDFEYFENIFPVVNSALKLRNSDSVVVTMGRNGGKFYCGRRLEPDARSSSSGNTPRNGGSAYSYAGVYSEDEWEAWSREMYSDETIRRNQQKPAQNNTCTQPHDNCVSCMKMDITMRSLPFGWLVNKNGTATQFIPCQHFNECKHKDCDSCKKIKSRGNVCLPKLCGQGPSYFCSQNEQQNSRSQNEQQKYSQYSQYSQRAQQERCKQKACCEACQSINDLVTTRYVSLLGK